MQNQKPLPDTSTNDSSTKTYRTEYCLRKFKVHVDDLNRYQEKHGHMNITIQENKALYKWISGVKSSYKRAQEGHTPSRTLSSEKIEMLVQIGFKFPNSASHDDDSPESSQFNYHCRNDENMNHRRFKSFVEALKQYQAKHGHANVSVKENKRLYFWIANIRSNYKRIEKGLPPHKKFTTDQIEMLREIGFNFQSKRHIPFESRIEALQSYQQTHGHMRVSEREDRSLFKFISHVRQSVKMIQEGKTPIIKLTPERMTALKEIRFNFGTKRGGTLNSGIPDTSCNLFQGQRVEDTNLIQKDLSMVQNQQQPLSDTSTNDSKHSSTKSSSSNDPNSTTNDSSTRLSTSIDRRNYNTTSQERFNSFVEVLKQYQEKHGHMNVPMKENKGLYNWISEIKNTYKRIQKGLPPHKKLSQDQIHTLQQINFDFKSENQIPFESRIEALKRFQETHGHMRVTEKHDKSLHNFIKNVRQSARRMQGGKAHRIKLTPDRMTALKEIGFRFSCRSKGGEYVSSMQNQQLLLGGSTNASSTNSHSSNYRPYNENYYERFKAHVETLKQYHAEHGHMNIPTSNKVLYYWMANIRSNYKRIEKGLTPHKNLSPDQINMLREIGFDFKTDRRITFESRIEALKLYKEKNGHLNVTTKEDKSLHIFIKNVRQSAKRMQEGQSHSMKLTPDRMTALKEIGFKFSCREKRSSALISGIPSTSCNSSKQQRVEERGFHDDNHEEIPISTTFTHANENDDTEEIEGDIIPRWLISDEDEEEEDNCDSLLDEISIKIDGEAKVPHTSSTPVPDKCQSS